MVIAGVSTASTSMDGLCTNRVTINGVLQQRSYSSKCQCLGRAVGLRNVACGGRDDGKG